jgi:hypothetical protein
MKLSIILPLCDLRDAFERPLASLLNQRLERTRYEIVIVIPERDKHSLLGREQFKSLLSQCDQVIFVDADPDAPDSEIVFYSEGCEKATGDLLFFVEGHTVILPGACSAIYDHFSANPRCVAAWGRRLNHNIQTLGKLVGMHNSHHENAAKGQGWFTLGANSVIRKSVLSELGGFEPIYGRFNETILFEKLTKRGTGVEQIDTALALHYNDMSVAHLMELSEAMGRWRASYIQDNDDRKAGDQRFANHGLAWMVRGRGAARVCLPVFRTMSAALLQTAKLLYDVNDRLAYRMFVSGLGFCELSGYTHVRLRGGKD